MMLTVSNEINGEVYGPLEVSSDMNLVDLVALLEIDCGFDLKQHDLYFNTILLDPNAKKTLKELGLGDDDLILMRRKVTTVDMGMSPQPLAEISEDEYIERFRLELLGNPALRQSLHMPFDDINELVNDKERFKAKLGPLIAQRRGGSTSTNPYGVPDAEYNRLIADPENPENKKKLEELKDKQVIDEQLRNALEYTPEVFAQVSMLYINMEINGHPVKAFVDSGAQMTIMSPKLAEKTELKRFIDKRFIGEARGVGTGKILGRIHQAQVKIESQFVPCSFVVLDSNVDLLLGLDMLKRHQACIDLENNVLRIAGTETKFLNEAEIPKDTNVDMLGNPQTKSTQIPSAKKAKPSITVTPKVRPTTNKPENNAGAGSFPDATIKQLMDLGFSRQEVIQALTKTNGNADFAASLLFQ
ncbi:DNA damage-inducible protein 1 [Nakaseomyces bracarensis]|uniref:DNA damage-inducible protein 1 n=1 Tax=Nakaseomyces bracarensis TaxID=273131 RepID=A0ABR4NZK0_9SACH